MSRSRCLLIIFAKNPVLGRVKTRLAATLGEEKALSIYQQLLQRTQQACHDLPFDKSVHYGQFVDKDDVWDNDLYQKKLQSGEGLGERMYLAFEQGFKGGYEKICLIGSDIYGLSAKTLIKAFEILQDKDCTIGPAQDGGYYLIGMKKPEKAIFNISKWSEPTVYQETLANLNNQGLNYGVLPLLRDIDYESDLKGTDLSWQ